MCAQKRARLTMQRRGIVATGSGEVGEDAGTLPTMTELLVAACAELSLDTAALLYDPCGSHVLRSALRLYFGLPIESNQARSGGDSFRSKKSKRYMAHQAPLRSLLPEEDEVPAAAKDKSRRPPKALRGAGKALVASLNAALAEPTALKQAGAHHIATITVQVCIRARATSADR